MAEVTGLSAEAVINALTAVQNYSEETRQLIQEVGSKDVISMTRSGTDLILTLADSTQFTIKVEDDPLPPVSGHRPPATSYTWNYPAGQWVGFAGCSRTFDLDRALLVEAYFKANLSIPGLATYGALGVNATGALTLTEAISDMGFAGGLNWVEASFGFRNGLNTPLSGRKLFWLPEGQTKLELRGMRNTVTNAPVYSYIGVIFKPIRWWEEGF